MSGRVFKGSCHCGAVTFSARIDPAAPTIRCNCSICTKSRTWIAPIAAGDFQLLSGADALSAYRFGSETITHRFCAKCGIKTHGDGGEWIAVSIAALDLEPAHMGGFAIGFADGRRDRPEQAPPETGYL